jgi:hypothetical protein
MLNERKTEIYKEDIHLGSVKKNNFIAALGVRHSSVIIQMTEKNANDGK